jgi:hypothetical protein
MSDWTRIEQGQALTVLDALSRAADAPAFTAEETDVDCRPLAFYGRYRLYRLVNRATLPAFSMYYLGDGEQFVALDGTANPIYTVSEQDPVRLSETTVVAYAEFFFSHVQGSEGDVFFVKDPRRTPLLASLDDARLQTIVDRHTPLTVECNRATGDFRLSGTLRYGDGLISAVVAVSATGKLSVHESSIILLWAKPPSFYSCFISHSFADQPFASKLSEALVTQGVKTWLSQKDILGGLKLHEQLKAGIQRMDKLLLVLSDTSIKSNWVGTEILEARQRERSECRSILFPIRITDFPKLADLELFDADEGRDLGREIRQFYIPDFSGWRHDGRFDAALKDLLRALRRPVWRMSGP